MAVTGKLVGHVEISAGPDVLHNLLRYKPHDISSISDCVHGCDLVSGQQGVVGSIICWNYTHDGKKQFGKEIIEEIDETNHKIVFKLIEGNVLEIYKAFKITFHVEPKDGKQLATWTFEFEKPHPSVPDPTSVMDLLCGIVKDMDVHACKP
uniref:kirola-like n=1 Tax=Erigeron canadensis TaxID=72917 RepID=UPI001CB96E39|nr:kirola-like [Erigeron canadensis]